MSKELSKSLDLKSLSNKLNELNKETSSNKLNKELSLNKIEYPSSEIEINNKLFNVRKKYILKTLDVLNTIINPEENTNEELKKIKDYIKGLENNDTFNKIYDHFIKSKKKYISAVNKVNEENEVNNSLSYILEIIDKYNKEEIDKLNTLFTTIKDMVMRIKDNVRQQDDN